MAKRCPSEHVDTGADHLHDPLRGVSLQNRSQAEPCKT